MTKEFAESDVGNGLDESPIEPILERDEPEHHNLENDKPEQADSEDKGDFTPWGERSDNPERARYPAVPGADRQLREYLDEHHVVDREALRLANPNDDFNDFRQMNCGEDARAVDGMLAGRAEAARPFLPPVDGAGRVIEPAPLIYGEPVEYMEQYFGRPGGLDRHWHGEVRSRYGSDAVNERDADVDRGFAELDRGLLSSGPGARAVVFVAWKPSGESTPPGADLPGHWLNAANVDGRINYYDAQALELGGPNTDFWNRYKDAVARMSWIRTERDR